MTITEKEIELVGSKGREKVIGLFDSGATYSCIKKELAEKLGVIEILPEPIELSSGQKAMQAWRLKRDFEHEDVVIDPRVTRIRLLLCG